MPGQATVFKSGEEISGTLLGHTLASNLTDGRLVKCEVSAMAGQIDWAARKRFAALEQEAKAQDENRRLLRLRNSINDHVDIVRATCDAATSAKGKWELSRLEAEAEKHVTAAKATLAELTAFVAAVRSINHAQFDGSIDHQQFITAVSRAVASCEIRSGLVGMLSLCQDEHLTEWVLRPPSAIQALPWRAHSAAVLVRAMSCSWDPTEMLSTVAMESALYMRHWARLHSRGHQMQLMCPQGHLLRSEVASGTRCTCCHQAMPDAERRADFLPAGAPIQALYANDLSCGPCSFRLCRRCVRNRLMKIVVPPGSGPKCPDAGHIMKLVGPRFDPTEYTCCNCGRTSNDGHNGDTQQRWHCHTCSQVGEGRKIDYCTTCAEIAVSSGTGVVCAARTAAMWFSLAVGCSLAGSNHHVVAG